MIDGVIDEAPIGGRARALTSGRLWAAVVLLVLALVLRQGILFLVAGLLVVAEGVSLLWGRHALREVVYRRTLSRRRAAWGEAVTLRLDVENHKRLPLAWLRVEDEVPADAGVQGRLLPSLKPGRRQLRLLLSLLWYQRVSLRYTLSPTARGEQLFGPATLRTSDIFGLATQQTAVPAYDTLLVYPKVVPLSALGLPAAQPFGDLATRRRLFEDPLRTIGVRDYALGDSWRSIHWKATARVGTPQVRVFEPVRTRRVVLFLDVVTSSMAGRSFYAARDADLLELAIVIAASSALYLLDEGCEVGLYSNGRVLHAHAGDPRREGEGSPPPPPLSIPPRAAPAMATAILEALALLHPGGAPPVAQVIAREGPRLPASAGAIVISAAVTPDLLDAAARLRAEGRDVTIIYVGDRSQPVGLPGITTRHVGGEMRWRTLGSLELG